MTHRSFKSHPGVEMTICVAIGFILRETKFFTAPWQEVILQFGVWHPLKLSYYLPTETGRQGD